MNCSTDPCCGYTSLNVNLSNGRCPHMGISLFENLTVTAPGDLATESNEGQQSCILYHFVIYTLILGTICVFGLIGNIISFTVFSRDKVKTSTTFLFQGLSIIDTVLLITVMPLYCIPNFVVYTGRMGGFKNSVFPYVLVFILPCAYIAQTSVIWVTVLVGINRWIAVCRPYQASKLCTVSQARKQLAGVIVLAIIYNIPKFAEARLVWIPIDNGTMTSVAPSLNANKLYAIIYKNIFYMLFLLIVPLLLLGLLNARLIRSLNELRVRRAMMQSQQQRQDNNVTLVLIIVVLVFIVCQTPALINQILWNILPDNARKCGQFQFYLSPISNSLVITNSAVNFLIYFFFNTRFRQILFDMCLCGARYSKKVYMENSITCNHEETQESVLR